MLEGSCHCGAVTWRFDGVPSDATACNCTICRRYATLWAYDYENERIQVFGDTQTYECADRKLAFHRCGTCGCVAYWRGHEVNGEGRRRIAVNLRLADPEAVGDIVVDHLDGFDTWKALPRDGRRVRDMWF